MSNNMPQDAFQKAAADAARHSIDQLQTILSEAQGYLMSGENLAAWGTLLMFEEAAEDLKAAIRLYRSANSRRKP